MCSSDLLLVPYPAGGSFDIFARVIAQKLSTAFERQFVVDNRGGASGIIAAELVARATADGYTLLFGGAGTALGLSEDMSKGIVDRFRSLPMARSAVLTGRVLADMVRNLFVVLLMIAVGLAVGFRFNNGFLPAFASIGLLLFFGMAFSWLFALIGLSVRDPESAQIASFLPVFPLTFAASTFVPLASMPSWLQAFARNQPVSHAVNAVRSLTQGNLPGVDLANAVFLTLAWSAGIAAVFAVLAVRKYRSAS